MLLRHYTPRSDAPQLSSPIARAAHASAFLAGLAALFLVGRAATTPLRGLYATIHMIYATVFGGMTFGLRFVARSNRIAPAPGPRAADAAVKTQKAKA